MRWKECRDLVMTANVIETPEQNRNFVDEKRSKKESIVSTLVDNAPQAIHAVAEVVKQTQ